MRLAVIVVLALVAGAAPAAAAGPRLVVQRTGGFAGVQDRLVLGASGTAAVTHRDGDAQRLPAARTRALREALRAARFSTLAAVYKPLATVNDGFVYVLRAAGRTVRVEDGAEHVPRRLQALIAAAGALLSG